MAWGNAGKGGVSLCVVMLCFRCGTIVVVIYSWLDVVQAEDQRTRPEGERTRGPEDQGTRGLEDQRTRGPQDHRTRGPEDQRTRGAED